MVMDMEGLEHLRAVFEEVYNEATVVMIRTRTPYHGGRRDDDNEYDQ